ncbi:hypothetical protein GCM10027203_27460 [Nonomuraea fastidiosa]
MDGERAAERLGADGAAGQRVGHARALPSRSVPAGAGLVGVVGRDGITGSFLTGKARSRGALAVVRERGCTGSSAGAWTASATPELKG